MAQKHLKELLKEDQEPFHLNDYIADRRCQLKKQPPLSKKTQIQIKKSKLPISRNVSFPSNFCKNACLFSSSAFIDSPDPRKSPLFDFSASPAAARSPFNAGGSNALFLNVPAKTAALLLEAAMRIQKQNSKPKNRTQVRNSGLGLLGSMLKRLTSRNRSTRKPEIWNETGDVNNFGKSRKLDVNVKEERETSFCNGRLSSVWSESNNGDNRSLDFLESRSNSCCSSSSGRSFEDDDDGDDDEFGDVEFVNLERENGGDFAFCLSPFSPFRFALFKSPSSPDRRSPSPGFASPPISPARRKFEETVNNEQETTVNFHVEEDEEDKEQNSPVSVLDPPFEDDDDEGRGGQEDEDGYDIECSYAYVQRAKQQLLHKLRRFEKLAELDPVELEKRLAEQEQESESSEPKACECKDYNASPLDHSFYKLNFRDIQKPGMKRLISHLITEEQTQESCSNDQEAVLKRVCKRLESWKEVESNTINMMVEMDLRRESDDWRKLDEQNGETAKQIECTIFAIVVDELLEELIDRSLI